jgi:hypothetical protein
MVVVIIVYSIRGKSSEREKNVKQTAAAGEDRKKNSFPPIYRSFSLYTLNFIVLAPLFNITCKGKGIKDVRARSTRSLRAITHCLIDFQQVYLFSFCDSKALMSHRERKTKKIEINFIILFLYSNFFI